MEPAAPSVANVSIDLLDTATGQPQQSWRFSGTTRIQIGRSKENDLVLANPYVSRSHACIEWADGKWSAISVSTQLLVCGGRRVSTIDLTSGTIFSLGPHGSCLRFFADTPETKTSDSVDFRGTLSFEAPEHPVLQLDGDLLSREVSAITEGEFFQSLARNLKSLRQTHHPPS